MEYKKLLLRAYNGKAVWSLGTIDLKDWNLKLELFFFQIIIRIISDIIEHYETKD